MATKKKGLPEFTVNKDSHPEIVAAAKEALDLRSQIADLETKEKAARARVAELGKQIRLAEQGKGNYIGIVKITDTDMTPVQVQHKMSDAALDLEEGPTIDHHFGAARPMLWDKDIAITGVSNPDALLQECRDKNLNPWDLVTLTVKPGVDRTFTESPNVVKKEAYLPIEGFLATINEVKNSLGPEAKIYLHKYLEAVLKATVSAGHK